MRTTRREFSVIIERDSAGYYVALVPELKGCHTQAKSLDTLMKRVREAIELCLEVERRSGRDDGICRRTAHRCVARPRGRRKHGRDARTTNKIAGG